MAEEEIPTIIGYEIFNHDGRWIRFELNELAQANTLYKDTAERGLTTKFRPVIQEEDEEQSD